MSDIDDLFDGFGARTPAPPPTSSGKAVAESRKETRVRANWPAKVLLPDGSVQPLWVYDLSETGVGFAANSGLPPNRVLTFAISVPDINGSRATTAITGTIKVAHMTIRGPEVHFGGPWVGLDSRSSELLNSWIRRLRK